jgi:hypothetical protein
MVRPERAIGVTLSIRLVVEGDETTLRVEDGHVGLSPVDGIADVTIEGAADALASAVAAPGSLADRGVEVRGDSRQVDQLLYILGLTDTPHSP